MSRIAVAVSGGADSLYALVHLYEQGHDILALHGLFLPEKDTNSTALAALEKLCAERGIALHIVDFRQEFSQRVIAPFVKAYAEGRTPNPCALCNKQVKFGLLMDKAFELGAEYFATGHYAALHPDTGKSLAPQHSPLIKGQDIRKDQSYFLSLVPRKRFEKILFPLAKTQKNENIHFLQAQGINIPIAKESQEICFVPADAYREFLLARSKDYGIKLGKGGQIFIKEDGQEILLPKKFGGAHAGLWQYTEGQRRGLGVAWKEPLYVCAKDSARNALILGNKAEATLVGCVTGQANFLVDPKHWPQDILVRVRYRQQEVPAKISIQDERLHIHFATAQSPTAPGQIAAVYDATGSILAGASIEEVF